ncbi:TATA element modulatory factor 1 TATA binding-domain-containing protein [Blakeslea trispora]|nr:TATA element modulatory factor 1 TATA binding-domain-containing protein [Blakeslea trispora]
MMARMQAAEEEQKHTIEKEAQLQKDLIELKQQLNETSAERDRLASELANVQTELETSRNIQKQLEERVELLTKETQALVDKEVRDQEGLKNQYQRLMKERLTEERKQFEIRLKAATAHSVPAEQQIEDMPLQHRRTPSISSRSSFDSSSTPTNVLVERLQSTIRQLENQLNFYQAQLSSSSQSRDELSEEVLSLTQELDQLRKQVRQTRDLQERYQQLDSRYQTLLELLGERTEQVEELKADLADVKEMYKSQVIDLVQKLDQLKKK